MGCQFSTMTAYSLRGTAGLPPVPGMQRVGKVITMETAPEKIVNVRQARYDDISPDAHVQGRTSIGLKGGMS